MNEFDAEEFYLRRAQFVAKTQRLLHSHAASCEVCGARNPTLLEKATICEPDERRVQRWLCRNHAKLLYSLNKKHFPEASVAQKNSQSRVTLPRILVDEIRIHFQIETISASVSIQLGLADVMPAPDYVIDSAQELGKRIRRRMKIAPYSQSKDCACVICKEARPIMLEVHHVDRERNSDRAVYLCTNHHALVSHIQENEQPDERDIADTEARERVATALGEGALNEVDGSFKHALGKLLKERLEIAKAAIANAGQPPEDDDLHAAIESSCC